MSLRTALASLPDDRETAAAAREVVHYFSLHSTELLESARIARATGVSGDRLLEVLGTLREHFVVDFDGADAFTLSRDPVVALEVQRFLRTGTGPATHLQRGIDRYRGRFGGGA